MDTLVRTIHLVVFNALMIVAGALTLMLVIHGHGTRLTMALALILGTVVLTGMWLLHNAIGTKYGLWQPIEMWDRWLFS